MKQGQSYDKLKKQYIIFICTGDPFGRGLYKYTFCNLCKEMTDLELVEERLKENSNNTVRQIASNMKAAGLETEQIVQICGLSLDEVELL